MFEQKDYNNIEDAITGFLEGKIRKNALNFMAYLNESQISLKQSGKTDWKIPFNDCYLCEIRIESQKWIFIFYFGDYSGDVDKGLIKTVQDNLQFCKRCNEGCMFGKNTTIFGVEYENVCSQLTVEIENPDDTTLEHIKTLIEYNKRNVSDSISWHAHNL